MRRRTFIIALAGSACARPLVAQAQAQGGLPVIGFLSSRSPGESADVTAGFWRGLGEGGFIEGQNVVITFRWAEGHYDRLPALAADLVAVNVAVLVTAGGPPAALAAKDATSKVPIVFAAADDPIRLGLVGSLNRPGANITGMSNLNMPLVAKSVELLKELLPTATAIAYLRNPLNPSAEIGSEQALSAATALGVRLHVLDAATARDLDEAFAALIRLRIDGVVVAGEPFFYSQRDRIVALSTRHAVPASYAWREYVNAGGLMSYGTSLVESYREAGLYTGRVLKGERPADLPVRQPTKFELVFNLRTARALGLTIPPTLLARADEVIE
jgi:putative tryptophan/tyrosine transport system substrate-binding protein